MKRSFKIFTMLFLLLSMSLFTLAACVETPVDNPDDNKDDNTTEVVSVSEVTLELSVVNAKIGDTVSATVRIRPTNATDQTFALSSSDETVATISSDNQSINCIAAGTVIITARSQSDPTKKAETTLVVLGADEFGRYENLFEAEVGNLIPSDGSNMKVENVVDDRLSGTGVVGSLSKGDRIVWGVEAAEADDDAVLEMSLMGPSGWLGMWDSIPYNFSDWYTIKVNGNIVDTSDVNVEGTLLRGGSADYYAVKDVTIGHIELMEGLNVITFVVSNRYDQTTISDDNYSGTLSCWGNIDSISIFSSKTLTYVSDTEQLEGADPDVIANHLKLEAEAQETRVYVSAENPKADLEGKTFAEFSEGMNVLFGLSVEQDMRTKLSLNVAAPFIDAVTEMSDMPLSQMIGININGKDIDLSGLNVLGNNDTNNKENFTTLETGWIDLQAGDNTIGIVVKNNPGFEYLGGLDYLEMVYFNGSVSPVLGEEPLIMTTVRFEAEADTTTLVGCDEIGIQDTYVEFKAPTQVEADVYAAKYETSKIIFGIESSASTYATVTMRVAAPYIDPTTPMTDVSIGSLGDLWVNGVMVSTPNTIEGKDIVGVKDNFTIIEIAVQIELNEGKNRISWEPTNYTSNDYEYLGALDYIELASAATLNAYKVNFWTDRHTYFDDDNNEPIWVTCASVNEANPNSCWIGVYRVGDAIEENSVGTLFYYYPTNGQWNSDGIPHLGEPVDVTLQNPNGERPLISAETGGMYVIVYFEYDGKNSTNGYTITDQVIIGVWNDVSYYGGRIDEAA